VPDECALPFVNQGDDGYPLRMTTPAEKLAKLGLTLPPPVAAVAAYVPYVITGNLVFISGQLPMENGQLKFTGSLGREQDLAAGQAAARLCAINILSQLNAACGGDLGRVERCVRLGAFIASAPGFFDQPKVANGASELMEQVFGDAGKHARAAVGVNILPLNAVVEVDAVFALKL
jgi:enamine deaminase RidA (YjgF/YER057c/UK114 family)